MTVAELSESRARREITPGIGSRTNLPPLLVAGVAFLILFWQPARTLVLGWIEDPESGHGLLLGPLSLYLVWRAGIVKDARPQPIVGLVLLVGAVALRYGSGLAAELFTMRLSLFGAVVALIVYAYGLRQIRHWWLPLALFFLSIPLPALVTGALALPLQFQASKLGAWMLAARRVPVALSGNVIQLPGRSLFVTEACSGLRSLTSLLALGVLIGGLWLRSPWSRLLLVALAVPIAMLLNGIRIFLTGFLVYYVDPSLGEGVMHYSEGWALFTVAFALLGGLAWLLVWIEGLARRRAT
ncbi:MAG: exosortase/archaeosortase family protein [Gemmatimonadetes bacterium]|nr:exosortase/archaeosortase family protein [Gemmatimonadota bacterium]